MVRTSLIVFALSLVACGGKVGDQADAGGDGAPPSPTTPPPSDPLKPLLDFCDELGKQYAACGSSYDVSTCKKTAPCALTLYRAEALPPLLRCSRELTCSTLTTGTTGCFAKVHAAIGDTAAGREFASACKTTRCPGYAPSFWCSDTSPAPLVRDEVMVKMTECVSTAACGAIDGCMSKVFSDVTSKCM